MVLVNFINAQSNTTISGTIKNSKTGEPVPDVSIKVKNSTTGTSSDQNGFFSLNLKTNNFTLLFSKIGFETYLEVFSVQESNYIVNINLKPKDIRLNEVTITSDTSNQKEQILNVSKLSAKDIDVPVTTNYIDSKLQKLKNSTDLGDAAKNLTGVRPINRYGGFQTFRIRGFNNFVLLVDGVRDERHNISTSAPSTNLSNVERIEVLKGPSSVLYGHSALGGIINIVRKNNTLQDR